MADEKDKKEEKQTGHRMVDILRIRKSNTKNSLWESAEGKAFIAKAKAGVKKAKTIENEAFFYVYEVLDD